MKFSNDHTWINTANNTVGISDYAQKSLGDIVYTELPEVGQTFSKGEEFGSVESVKSVSALYAPISFKVLEVNELMEDEPEIINTDPYGAGWILKVEILNWEELNDLFDEERYLSSIIQE